MSLIYVTSDNIAMTHLLRRTFVQLVLYSPNELPQALDSGEKQHKI